MKSVFLLLAVGLKCCAQRICAMPHQSPWRALRRVKTFDVAPPSASYTLVDRAVSATVERSSPSDVARSSTSHEVAESW